MVDDVTVMSFPPSNFDVAYTFEKFNNELAIFQLLDLFDTVDNYTWSEVFVVLMCILRFVV